jgi:hypothetical protein
MFLLFFVNTENSLYEKYNPVYGDPKVKLVIT